MSPVDFDKLLERRIAKTKIVLGSKGKEYGKDVDVLHNFKRSGELRELTPQETLLGMLVKHWVSIEDMVLKTRQTGVARSVLDEKIGDAVCYLILLEAVLVEGLPYKETK